MVLAAHYQHAHIAPLETEAEVIKIDQFKILSGTTVVMFATRQECHMAVPLSVPISVRPADDKTQLTGKESVASILTRWQTTLISDWLTRTKSSPELNHLHLSDEERTDHLPRLVDDIVARLSKGTFPTQDSDASTSPAAVEHGRLRKRQGYSSAMLIHESRILQVTIFGALHKHLSVLDFNQLLPDVMVIADEVDSQLTQTMESFTDASLKSPKVQLVKPKA